MKLTQNKIDEIVIDILGKDGLRLAKALKDKENISEFTLATKLKRDIKIIRHMLYKLHNHNLVGSTRKKDKQKGWYVYYWTIIPENIKFLYMKNKKNILTKLKNKLKKEETDQFFNCPSKCVRLDFDQAIDFEFHCPECGELISQDQDKERLIQIQKKIDILEKELTNEEKEIAQEASKVAKEQLIIMEKEEKEKIASKKIMVKKKVVIKKVVKINLKKKSIPKKKVVKKEKIKKK